MEKALDGESIPMSVVIGSASTQFNNGASKH